MHSLWAGSRTGRPCHTLSAVPPGCHLPPARDLRESGRPQPTRSTPWYTKMFDIGAIFPPGGRQPTLGVKGRLCRTRRGPGCHRVKSCWTWSACFPAGLTLTGGTAKPGCRDSMRGDASGDLLNGSTTKCEHFSGKHWTRPASPLCCMYIYTYMGDAACATAVQRENSDGIRAHDAHGTYPCGRSPRSHNSAAYQRHRLLMVCALTGKG